MLRWLSGDSVPGGGGAWLTHAVAPDAAAGASCGGVEVNLDERCWRIHTRDTCAPSVPARRLGDQPRVDSARSQVWQALQAGLSDRSQICAFLQAIKDGTSAVVTAETDGRVRSALALEEDQQIPLWEQRQEGAAYAVSAAGEAVAKLRSGEPELVDWRKPEAGTPRAHIFDALVRGLSRLEHIVAYVQARRDGADGSLSSDVKRRTHECLRKEKEQQRLLWTTDGASVELAAAASCGVDGGVDAGAGGGGEGRVAVRLAGVERGSGGEACGARPLPLPVHWRESAQPDRILRANNADLEKANKFLVQWRGRGKQAATWEAASKLPRVLLEGFFLAAQVEANLALEDGPRSCNGRVTAV